MYHIAAADPGRPVRFSLEEKVSRVFQDTVRSAPRSGNRQQPYARPVDRTDKSVQDRLRDSERSSIKHVPRSVPKMKPQPVSDDVRVRGNRRN